MLKREKSPSTSFKLLLDIKARTNTWQIAEKDDRI